MLDTEIDLILFFKYLEGLKEEKSVKALGFKLEKHPSTIRRMIKKIEDLFNISLIIYENYQVLISEWGYKFLDKYYELQDNITLNDLYKLTQTNKKSFSIQVTHEFLIPYVLNFLEKNSILFNSFIVNDNINYENQNENNLYLNFTHYPINNWNSYSINLFFFQPKEGPNVGVIIDEYIYIYLKKIMDFSIFDNLLVINNLFLFKYYINKGYSFIGYKNFITNGDDYKTKSLNFSLKIFTNYNEKNI